MAIEQGKTVAIIGAGPVGLAAAAHASERGFTPLVLEAGPDIAHAVRQWAHVRLFSPWEYNVDRAAARLLDKTGWNSPDPQHYPTGGELLEQYLEPLAKRTALKDAIQTSSRVTAISRAGMDKVKTKGREQAQFEIQYQNGAGPKVVLADAIVDTSGSWTSPNPAGANGVLALGESTAAKHIVYSIPDILGADRKRYAGKRVAVLGSGHSAVGTLIDLVALKEAAPTTDIVWLVRGDNPEKAFGGGANDKLVARGELGSAFERFVRGGRLSVQKNFRVTRIGVDGDQIRLSAETSSSIADILADELIVSTGFRPDFSFLRELRVLVDPSIECPPVLAPLIDPNEHSCGTVRPHGARELAHPEPNFYLAGMKSYGRAPNFLMVTGYEQVRSIMADLAGDKAAAEQVELVLPETGVCSRPVVASSDTGCCGGAPKQDASACCVKDEQAKARGDAGCGCS